MSYEPAGSSAITLSVVPIVIGFDPLLVLVEPELFLPWPHAPSATTRDAAVTSTSPVLLSVVPRMSPSLRRAGGPLAYPAVVSSHVSAASLATPNRANRSRRATIQ